MRALVVSEPGQYSVERVEDPAPGPRDVVVAPAAVGVCGTDLHILDGEFAPTPYPIIPGHEFAGTVVAVGSEVTGLAVDDRVAVDPSLFCGECAKCAVGRGNLCASWNAIGVTTPGAAAEFAVAPAASCYRMPDTMPFAHGALVEPLSCAVHGFDLLPGRVGEHYLVYGAGTMGLLMAQLARSAGAASVSVVDPNTDRLAVAERLAADAVAPGADALDRADWEVVVDCTGVVAAIEDGLTRVARGGTFQVFGVAPAEASATFSPFRVYNDEVTVVGSMAVLHSYGRAVDLMAKGVVDADAMVTDTFALDDYGAAVDAFRAGRGRKLQVDPRK
ncbi:zinc-dependent alcohol dehydrogenase family protein [Nocardiopsis aegyptia]|uniref:2-desacetyl-2-hydroxyethyl bacteriochlorophyllide A dehydrogenase n=1 Tax=Nocardiopsis aegyptia TaxID=220378 RepID=A0A7Z0EKU3_9ACTN|nr:zinc-dependent alcohol dehydrogenase family protein [Nocardiopsis aegyptia]NYJ33115.1 2-desacetyl-2-hydroxyethyl bacteriochlorophyllide A dehydrogenase [Nocardiopsis aegyptia]